jgi:hypothetical protein
MYGGLDFSKIMLLLFLLAQSIEVNLFLLWAKWSHRLTDCPFIKANQLIGFIGCVDQEQSVKE